MKILLIDDDLLSLKLLSILVRHLAPGYEIFMTSNPETSMVIFEREKDIDIVITDMQMPDYNGDYLCHWFKKHRNIKCMLVSCNANNIRLNHQFDAVLQKPIDHVHFEQEFKKML
jgi:CheY-like chemotaxis protein